MLKSFNYGYFNFHIPESITNFIKDKGYNYFLLPHYAPNLNPIEKKLEMDLI